MYVYVTAGWEHLYFAFIVYDWMPAFLLIQARSLFAMEILQISLFSVVQLSVGNMSNLMCLTVCP